GATVNDVGLLRIDSQRSNVQDVLIIPARSPGLAGILALPNSTAGSSSPKTFGMRRVTGKTGNSPARVCWSNRFPFRRNVRWGRQRLLNSAAFAHKFIDRSFSDWPGSPR